MGKALTVAAFGARGTGKSAWIKQLLIAQRPSRLIVWDFKHDPGLIGTGRAFSSLPEFIRAMKAPAFELRYLVAHQADIHAQFDVFCKAAFQAGNLVMFVDELPEVTKANKAPAAWRRCVNVGRDYTGADGKRRWLSIIGAGQRPAECDKSFIGNCDVIHVGRLAHQADAREMAQSLGCDFRQLLALPDLDWIERRAGDVSFSQGRLSFTKNNSKKVAAPKRSLGTVPKEANLR